MNKLALPCAAVLFAAVTCVFADDYDKKTDVTIDQPVEVPGGVVLQPGTYMFKLMNATANRHIVQISSDDGKKTFAVVMTAAARRTERSDKTILTFYEMPTGTPQAVRKWFWPGDLDGQEFLYPHDRATQISKLTNEKVPEAPEGQPLIDNSTTAAQATTSAPTSVPTSEPAVVAQANEPAPAPAPANVPTGTAQVQATPPPAAAPAPIDPTPSPSPQNSTDNSTLPQTASDLPLLALVGLTATVGALMLRRTRRA
jgi:LPXTG-motif cell wall-anchored protein